MPIYEYECLQCGKHHELIQKISDTPLIACPDCGGKTEKKLSQTGFQLKGGGWYADGYSTKKPSGESKTEGEKTKTDVKPVSPAPKDSKKESQ